MELMAKDAEKESGIPWENYMWAGVGEATVDHVVPQSLGGTDDIENLVPCCKTCNSKKGSRNTISVSMEYPDADYLFDPANKLGKRGATR
jgi:5-methylcytosine-specific restriction endonuclease McrA